MATKLVVRTKKKEDGVSSENTPPRTNSRQRKAAAWHEALHAAGVRQYRFVWPLGTIERLILGTEKKANDYVLELIEKEINNRGQL